MELKSFQGLVNSTLGTNDNEHPLALLDVWAVGYADDDMYCAEYVEAEKTRYIAITGEYMYGMELLDSKLIIEEKTFNEFVPKKFNKLISSQPIIKDVRIKNTQQEIFKYLEKLIVIAEFLYSIDFTEHDDCPREYPLDDVEELNIFRYVRKM